jgi:REP element-mobilizing transposase RayT
VLFYETLSQACGRTGWRVHAYVLMDDHDHLLLKTPEPNLVAGMKWLHMIGTLVRKRTMAGNEWIAKRFTMGDPSRVSRYCADAARNGERAFNRKLDLLEKMANSTG